ncbi:MAG TPA: protein kinase [Gemmatimonadales bacterium]
MDLRAQLQDHLGAAFVLGRELGGGGMSRVFVADEVRLSRTVVVKVLSPDLVAGINAERFEREILLAASLQQANIVPVLAAGEVAGLPYFTMPFVEGESLRNRLTGGGLPIADVLAILRDVTKALAYAHARNIVHRDIKPDNVLLSGGTAVVTDFGIAKALSASRTAGAGATLTSVGTSIGTPAYMAPEQVAGDPNFDHRVDLYALGCMAQELLTGKPPFADRTPQRILAAHLSETAPSITSLRPDCPAALSALVARLLQKDPADRFQSANDVLHALDAVNTTSTPTLALGAPGSFPKVLAIYLLALGAVAILAKAAIVGIGLPDWVFPGAMAIMLLGFPMLLFTAYTKRIARHAATATPTLTPGGTRLPPAGTGTMATIALKANPYLSWRKTARAGAYAMAAFILLVAGFMTMRAFGIGSAGSLFAKGQLAADDKIVLADFRVADADSALAPIVSAAVRAAMSQSKSVRLVEQADVAQLLQQMQRPRATALDSTMAREVAQRAGAKAVLGGRLARIGTGYAVSLELVSADRGATLASFQGTANGPADLLAVVDKLTRDLRGKIGESLRQVQRTVPLEQATTASLDALRKYSQAVVANDIDGDYDRAVTLLRQAVAYDSTFALAWRKLGLAIGNSAGSPAARDSALTKALRYSDKLPDRERNLAAGAYYGYSVAGADRGKTVAAYQAVYAADSTGSGAIVAVGDLGQLFATRHQYDSAERYARRASALHGGPLTSASLVQVLLAASQVDSAAALLDSLVKAVPAVANADVVTLSRYLIYHARNQRDSADALLAKGVASPVPATRIRGLEQEEDDALMTGRLTRAVNADAAMMALLPGRGIAAVDGITAAAADIVYRSDFAAGVRALDAVVAGPQWSQTAPQYRPYLLVVGLYAFAGRPDRARDVLARNMALDPAAKAPDSRSDQAAAEGFIAVAEHKYPEAIAKFHASAVGADGEPSTCVACADYGLARAFDQAGQADSAFRYFRAYLSESVADRLPADPLFLAATYKRLGELYEARHDKTNAIAQYQALTDLWKGADPDLQPVVAQARKRITELQAQEGAKLP